MFRRNKEAPFLVNIWFRELALRAGNLFHDNMWVVHAPSHLVLLFSRRDRLVGEMSEEDFRQLTVSFEVWRSMTGFIA